MHVDIGHQWNSTAVRILASRSYRLKDKSSGVAPNMRGSVLSRLWRNWWARLYSRQPQPQLVHTPVSSTAGGKFEIVNSHKTNVLAATNVGSLIAEEYHSDFNADPRTAVTAEQDEQPSHHPRAW